MKKIPLFVAAAASIVGVLSVSRPAHALGPLDLEVGANVGAGTNPFAYAPNPLGFGLGGRAGVSFLGIYAGVNVMYYFGGTVNGLAGDPQGFDSVHSITAGAELGYGFRLFRRRLTIRPLLGIGNITFSESETSSIAGISQSSSGTENNLYFQPGVAVLAYLGPVYAGFDMNALIITGVSTSTTSTAACGATTNSASGSSTNAAFTAHGQVGVRF
jgi:hypothetical protein